MAEWTGRSGGNALGWKLVLTVLSILGRRWAYGVASLTAAFYLLKGPSPGLRAYFERVLPDVPWRKATWRLYRSFAIALIDRLAFLMKGPMQFRYRYEGLEHLREVFAQPGGAILLSSHHGNIEIIHSGTGKADKVRRVKILRFEAECLPSGPWLLAALARVPVVEVECRKIDQDLCEVTIRPPYEVVLDRSRPRTEQLRDYAAAWAKRLEESVRKSPYEWYNFHPFWKDPPST